MKSARTGAAITIAGLGVGACSSGEQLDDVEWRYDDTAPMFVQVSEQAAAGRAPEDFTIEDGTHCVRKDVANIPPRVESPEKSNTVEDVAEAERSVVVIAGVEYISDPDLERAQWILDGKAGPEQTRLGDVGDAEELSDAEQIAFRESGVFGSDGRVSVDSISTYYPFSAQVRISGNGRSCSGTTLRKTTILL